MVTTLAATPDPAPVALWTLLAPRERPFVEQIHDAFLLGASAAELMARIQLAIQAEYDFMVEVVWNNTDRKEEVMRVAHAAFRPLGTFAMASQIKESPPPDKQASS